MARVTSVSPDALRLLLARLHQDLDRAAADYERLHGRLIRFFEWKHCPAPDQLADETLDRVALRLGDGERIVNIGAFVWGVAARVRQEQFQRPVEVSIEAGFPTRIPVEDPRQVERDASADLLRSRMLERQRRCLQLLAPQDRDLIMVYHRGRGIERIRARQALAKRIGIGINALRIRAHRIRSWLVNCVGKAEDNSALSS